jgi:DNA-binding Lrp family transcriptional regulator
MFVFKTLLKIQVDSPEPLSFSKIYDVVNEADRDNTYSKAWVHRLLKELIDRGLVRTIGDSSSRKQYVCDVNTLRTGIERIKDYRIEEMNIQLEEAKTTIDALRLVDSNTLANQLFVFFTGEYDTPSSRFLSGLDEFHRVTEETIYDEAKEGDVIRCSVIDVASFAGRMEDRVGRILTTPSLGAEIRYKVTSEVFNIDQVSMAGVPSEWLIGFVKGILQMHGKDLDFRITRPHVRGYQFVSLNDEVMALMISDNPVTAAWVTRRFNANLIDNVIESFDSEWESSIPLASLTTEHLKAMGVKLDSYMTSIFEEASKSIEQ